MENTNRFKSLQAESFFGQELKSDNANTEALVNTNQIKLPSERQIETYKRQCQQKNKPECQSAYESFSAMDKAIKELMALPFWKAVSDAQKERIAGYCAKLNIAEPNYDLLNGAYYDEKNPIHVANKYQFASYMIGDLIERCKNIVTPIQDKQAEWILQMQLCPDCEGLTDEEINSMDSKEASEYITKNKELYYAWKNTRLSQGQMRMINTLLSETGNPELEFHQIIQFDREFADKYIQQLIHEKHNLKDFMQASYVEGVEERYMERFEKKQDKLVNLIHQLYALRGEQADSDTLDCLTAPKFVELLESVRPWGDYRPLMEKSKLFSASEIENPRLLLQA